MFKYDVIMFDKVGEEAEYPLLSAYAVDRNYFEEMIYQLEYMLNQAKSLHKEFAEDFEKAKDAETVEDTNKYFQQMDEAIEAMEGDFNILCINRAIPNDSQYVDIFAATLE